MIMYICERIHSDRSAETRSSPQERLPNYCPEMEEVEKLLAAASVSEESSGLAAWMWDVGRRI